MNERPHSSRSAQPRRSRPRLPAPDEETEVNVPGPGPAANRPADDDDATWSEDVVGGAATPAGDADMRELSSTRLIGGDESTPAVAPDSKGPVAIGDFELLQKIGEGAMGAVYRARQISFDREVALKVLIWRATSPSKLIRS